MRARAERGCEERRRERFRRERLGRRWKCRKEEGERKREGVIRMMVKEG